MRLVSATSSSWPLPHFGILAGWQVDILKQQQHQHMQIRVGPSFRRFKFNKYANRMINKTSMCNNEGLRAAEQICFKLRISKAHSPPPPALLCEISHQWCLLWPQARSGRDAGREAASWVDEKIRFPHNSTKTPTFTSPPPLSLNCCIFCLLITVLGCRCFFIFVLNP